MALAEDLLSQARILAMTDPGKPKQANLRRAVSSAYYALFHLLIAESVQKLLVGHRKTLMDRVSRAFQHGEMQKACRQWQTTPLPPVLKKLLDGDASSQLISLAASFVDLQEARHTADYDVSARFSRADVLGLVEDAELAFDSWDVIKKSEEMLPFLASLAFGARWSK
jgi:hypothetical protein